MGIKNQFENLKQDIRLRGYSEKTADAYVNANEKFAGFIKKDTNLVTSADIKKYINYLLDKKHKPKTINLIISALKYYYDEFRGRNLFKKIKRIKLEKTIPTVL